MYRTLLGRKFWPTVALSLALGLATVTSAHAALTTSSCLAKKAKEWGKLRNCQARENGKAMQAKPFDLAKCQTKFALKLGKLNELATAAAIECRYGINGDGTATDYDMGLQWERKTDDASLHDKDNAYTWNTSMGGTTPNGTAFTGFLGTLNAGTSVSGISTSGCFASHCDWRLPAVEELSSIFDADAPGCIDFSAPCIDQLVFGPTAAFPHWSASTYSADPAFAWLVSFFDGFETPTNKSSGLYVRAVRSAL
jgi:hypothetical protein